MSPSRRMYGRPANSILLTRSHHHRLRKPPPQSTGQEERSLPSDRFNDESVTQPSSIQQQHQHQHRALCLLMGSIVRGGKGTGACMNASTKIIR